VCACVRVCACVYLCVCVYECIVCVTARRPVCMLVCDGALLSHGDFCDGLHRCGIWSIEELAMRSLLGFLKFEFSK